jgi:uncharacterized protein (TIGR03437 family)
MRFLFALLLAVVPRLSIHAQALDASTLKWKVLLGYQGWFRCPGGGTSGTNWSHWTSSGAPTAASISIDMYPDLREFESGEACQIPNMTVTGAPAYLFSAGNSKTVARHFRWMRHYGLDGVLVQRFVSDIPGDYASGDAVLRNIMAAAGQYGRVFAIEYDISGANPATLLSTLQQDWNYLVNTLQVTSNPRYLHENGKPVVSVWGIGLNDSKHPPNDVPSALQFIDWFRTTAQVTYIGGTPAYWRTNSNDAWTDPAWTSVYRSMDVIQPWTVGRYGTQTDVDNWLTNRIAPDLAATANNDQMYMPVIFPGFSWYNLNRNAPQNQIPRNGGNFIWRQAYNARRAGAQMLKIAMFDEVNEGTANFKVAARRQDAPDQGYWLTLDADGYALPSDWYLRLAGEITRIFHGQSDATPALPTSPGPPWPDASGNTGLSVVSAASLSGAALAAESIATATGTGLATSSQTATDDPLPTELAGTSVDVIDSTGFARPAPLLYVSATQVNFEIPAGTAAGNASIVVTGSDGTASYGGTAIGSVAPGLFSADASGNGVAAGVVRLLHADGTVTATVTFTCSDSGECTAVPVSLGSATDEAMLALYGTGIRGRSSLDNVVCTISGTAVPVLYAGPQGQFAGEDRIDLSLPRSFVGAGLVSINLTVDGQAANTVTLMLLEPGAMSRRDHAALRRTAGTRFGNRKLGRLEKHRASADQ